MYILAGNYCIIENCIGIIFSHVLMDRVTTLYDLCFYLWKCLLCMCKQRLYACVYREFSVIDIFVETI